MLKNKNPKTLPFVSICTPTFNRRPFFQMIIKCFLNQTYPREKMEWLIIDDGTDKIEDLICDVPNVKYLKYEEKMTLGKKRNILNEKSNGNIIIYMDDDDYYPPDRVKHAVETLNKNPKALCVGSSAMYIYFKHINKTYKFGPYGPNHSTAATFAFRRELLKQTKFNEISCIAEEKEFLKNYSIPFAQLEPEKTILVFSHIHNSFDKKELLKQIPNPTVNESNLLPKDIIKDKEILKFFMEDIDDLLIKYDAGKIENKPDVLKQIKEIKETREETIRKQQEYQNIITKITNQKQLSPEILKLCEQENKIQQLTNENLQLKEKVNYLDGKIKELINCLIKEKNKIVI